MAAASRNRSRIIAGKSLMAATERVPLFLNPGSGSAERCERALSDDARVNVRRLRAGALRRELKKAVEQGAERVIVCGGDGTLSLAAACLAGSATALGVIPGGTLNHFARRHGIPENAQEALETALQGERRDLPLGTVNGRVFLNTSSVGAYVVFVRTRTYLQRRMSYHSATLLAGMRRLARFRSARMEVGGRELRTPLVFVGVNERELRIPFLGEQKTDARPGLHVIALPGCGRWSALRLAFNAIIRGIDPLRGDRQLHSDVRGELTLRYRRSRRAMVALDGEVLRLRTPLRYCYRKNGLSVILPEPSAGH